MEKPGILPNSQGGFAGAVFTDIDADGDLDLDLLLVYSTLGMTTGGVGSDTVLVTGASRGLGLALAKKLIETEYRLVLTAREQSLCKLAEAGINEGPQVMIRPLDVTSSAQRKAVVHEVDAEWGGVDILVNNAGVAYRAVVEHVDQEERLAQMDVNFLSPMHLMRLVLPGLREKRHGRIINVSSVGGMMAMPTMSIYSASKFALEGVTEALWYEVRPWGIKVTLVAPGFIHSPSFQNTRYTMDGWCSAADDKKPYHAHYEHMAPFIEKIMNRALATPEKIANRIYKTMRAKNPPLRVYATMDAHLFALARRVMPRFLYHGILYRLLPQIKKWGPQKQ